MSFVLLSTWFGTFLLRDDTVHLHTLFPREPEAIAKRIRLMRSDELLGEEKALAGKETNFLTNDHRLLKLGATGLVTVTPPNPGDWDFDLELLQKAMILLGKEDSQLAVTRDLSIVAAVNTIDDITKSWNLLWERLRNWYGLHFPELEYMVTPQKYVELIATYGDPEAVSKAYHGTDTQGPLDTVGSQPDPNDIVALQEIAKTLSDLQTAKGDLESFIEEQMQTVAPNLSHLAGSLIGARLIAQSGDLATLSKTPASTIQLLGAEKALFRHIAEGTPPPKHGVIFQHPIVNTSPYWQRGKLARSLAAKIAIAAKVDQYGGDFIGDSLASEMKRRTDAVKKQFSAPPKRRAGIQASRATSTWKPHSKRRGGRGKRKR